MDDERQWQGREREGKRSELMLVEVIWRVPINGSRTARAIVAHLHNELAKKPESEQIHKFWDKLADFCAGGGGGGGIRGEDRVVLLLLGELEVELESKPGGASLRQSINVATATCCY